MTKNNKLDRRNALKVLGLGATVMYASAYSSSSWSSISSKILADIKASRKNPNEKVSAKNLSDDYDSVSPIDRSLGDKAPRRFSGDTDPSAAHKVLWNKKDYITSIGGLPTPTEVADIVVVGGGISGLMSTYFLRDHNIVLFEQGPRFGGNSRGESWHGLDYPLGASYFGVPTKGSSIDKFLNEIKVSDKIRVHNETDPIFIDGKKYTDYWQNGTLPENKDQFVKLDKHLADVRDGKNGEVYPEVPLTDETRERTIALDKISFKNYVEKFLGEPMHPHLEHVVEYYFWSSAASSAAEISAAVGLYFLAADMGGMAVTPGGNSAIAEATLKALRTKVPTSRLRASTLVFDVRQAENGNTNVSFVAADGKPATIQAKKVIMACPKFVVSHIWHDIEPSRREVIEDLDYRSYLLANVLVNQHLEDNFYDVYFMNEAHFKEKNTREKAHHQKATDMTYGNLATPDPKRVVLTAYRGLPFDNAREHLYKPNAYETYREEFEKQIYESFLPKLGIKKENVADLRITRWGHPLPLARVGQIADKKVDALRKPFHDKIFFVEQDNWMTPAFEIAFSEAEHWTNQIKALVKVRPQKLEIKSATAKNSI